MHTNCRIVESRDLLGAEVEETILCFLEKARALLFENEIPPFDNELSKLLIGIDCRESKSSSPDEATEPRL